MLNTSFKGKKIALQNQELFDRLFKEKRKQSNSMLIYYDADCWVCFEELKKWKSVIPYFKKADQNLNLKFILFTEDQSRTVTSLEKINFPKSLVVYDRNNTFLKQYKHISNKPYNTMLLDKDHRILFIGSPLNSENLKEHYIQLISNK
jgi:hypothetical protein